MTNRLINNYISILKEEMLPAVGCTEPLAIAYAAAVMRDQLGCKPDRIKVGVSENILKNTKSVYVPNSNGMYGIPAAVSMGVVAGDANAGLEVIAKAPASAARACRDYLKSTPIDVYCLKNGLTLDIMVHGFKDGQSVVVRVANAHTNLVYIAKNNEIILDLPADEADTASACDRSILNIKSIVDFADTVDIGLIRELFSRQVSMNMAIAEEGFKNDYGSNIGKLVAGMGSDPATMAQAYAAAASDARMSGCSLPVVILSGSGNQGITASVPVIKYAQLTGADEERMYRALAVSALITIHLKTGIGKLSAYCGAISAGCGAGAGIAYLRGAGKKEIGLTVSNALGMLSGTICDGAKASCASKIALSVRAGFLAYEMVRAKCSFKAGDGIIGANPEETVRNAGILGHDGMRTTDKVIVNIMCGQ